MAPRSSAVCDRGDLVMAGAECRSVEGRRRPSHRSLSGNRIWLEIGSLAVQRENHRHRARWVPWDNMLIVSGLQKVRRGGSGCPGLAGEGFDIGKESGVEGLGKRGKVGDDLRPLGGVADGVLNCIHR